jgi:hypothetical protein
MATLFNTKIKDTYQSLLKLEDNTILTTTTKNITDGLGNASPLFMSTTQVRIGSTSGSAMYWDNVNNRLGVGTSSPTSTLSVNGSISGTSLSLSGTLQGTGTGDNYLKGSGFTIQSATNNTDNGFYISTASLLERKVLFLAQNLGSYGRSDLYLCINGDATATNASISDSKVVFKANGNVLIGTTTDSGYKLDVNGTARFSGAVTADTSNGTFGGIILDYNGGTRRIRPSGNSLDLTDVNGLKAFQVNQSSNPQIAVDFDGVNFIRGLVSLQYTMGSTQQVVLTSSNYVGHLTPFFDIKATGYANSKNTDLRLYTDNTTSGTYGNIIIGHNGTNATGNVGIGTSSPAALLHVNGTSRFQGQASFGGALEFGNSGAFFQFLTTTSNNYYFGSATGVTAGGNVFARTIVTDNILSGGTGVQYAPLTITGGSYNTFATPSISFITWDGGSQTTRFYINSRTNGGVNGNIVANPDNGNFLIGTTTDSGFKLDVNGTARTGNLTIGTSGQGTVTAGAINFLYPNTINYQTVYDFLIQPTSGTTGNLKFYGNYLELFGNNNSGIGLSFSTSTSNTVTIQKTQGGADSTKYLNISGSDQTNTAYSGGGGVVRIYGGLNNGTAAQGMVILAHDGTVARGNVGVGEASPTARLQVKGSGSTSATTSLLVQNSAATTTLSVNDAGELSLPSTAPKITLGGNLTITSTVSPTRQMVYDVLNGNLSIYSGGVGEGYFIGNRLTNSRTSTAFVTPNALNNLGSSSITAYDNDGNIALQASNNGNRSIVLKGLGASGAVLIGNITTANGSVYSAILQADSTTQGFLPPRMTNAQRLLITTPAVGLMVYCTDAVEGIYVYKSTGWTFVA